MGLKREEVIGDWRKLHSHELHGLYERKSESKVPYFIATK